jgi:hypothetical protein
MLRSAILIAALASAVLAQSKPPTIMKGYKNQEEYCRENPKMPTCIKMQPLTVDALRGGLYDPKKSSSSAPAPRRASTPPARIQWTAPNPVALRDWRFSHPSPAILMSLNFGSLSQSPLWNRLLSGWAEPADIEDSRKALAGAGQALLSIRPNGGAMSVLMLARGGLAGSLGASLGPGMQSKRIDEITTLAGDANVFDLAAVRVKSTVPRPTANPVQVAAAEESAKYDAWIGFDPRQLAAMASAFGANSNAAASMSVLRLLAVGFYLRDQIRIEAQFDATAPEYASKILAALQKSQGTNNQIWITQTGSRVSYIEIMDAAKMDESPVLDPSITAALGPALKPLIQSLSASAKPQNPVPVQSSGGAIVIQGLGPTK